MSGVGGFRVRPGMTKLSGMTKLLPARFPRRRERRGGSSWVALPVVSLALALFAVAVIFGALATGPAYAQNADLSFGDASISDQSWHKDDAITTLTLPQASGGTDTVMLSFQAEVVETGGVGCSSLKSSISVSASTNPSHTLYALALSINSANGSADEAKI